MTQPIIIFGAGGQVGSALQNQLQHSHAISFDIADADFNNPNSVITALEGLTPDVIINAAAYTAVDKAESERELAEQINNKTPGLLADYCKEHNIILVHYSTDYVFNGQGTEPYTETSSADPINHYGHTKHRGEQAIIDSGCNHLIFRTSWVYNSTHKNFLTTMLSLAKSRAELSIVSDQIGAPTYAPDLASCTIEALKNAQAQAIFPSGIYHLCGGGHTSWHGFANEIFSLARKKNITLAIEQVHAIQTDQYPTPASRPLNSRLDCSHAKAMLNVSMPPWQNSLITCIGQLP